MDESLDQEAWRRLERKLREAKPQREINNRVASETALEAILEFIYKARPQWAVEQLHRPLLDLMTGLIDLDRGRRGPLLSPTPFDNRHPDAALLQMRRGYAIFAVEQLVAMGDSATVSAEKVAKIWNKCTGEIRDPLTIKSWYDRRDKIPKDDLAFDALGNLRALWDAENLDRSSADDVKNALRATGIDDDLRDHLPRTERDILDFLVRSLAELKPGP